MRSEDQTAAAMKGERDDANTNSNQGPLDYFMLLEHETVEALRRDFMMAEAGSEEGIDIYSFVRTLLKYWPTDDLEVFIANLLALFEVIDVDGSGQVSWQEFLDFCVEAGDWATKKRAIPWNHTYKQAVDFRDTVSSFHHLQVLKYIPELNFLLLVEEGGKSMRVLTEGCKLVNEIYPEAIFNKLADREKRQQALKVASIACIHSNSNSDSNSSSNNSGGGSRGIRPVSLDPAKIIEYLPEAYILAVEWLPKYRQLVISTLDGQVSFWDVDAVHSRVDYVSSFRPQTPAMHGLCPITCLDDVLLSWSHDKGDYVIYAWDLVTMKLKFKCQGGHRTTILCVLEVPTYDLLASGDMAGTLIFWDLKECRRNSGDPSIASSPPLILSHHHGGGRPTPSTTTASTTTIPTSTTTTPSTASTTPHLLSHHQYGIRALAYSPEHEILISVGFDVTGYAWDINSLMMQIRLVGHRTSIIDVKIVKHETERALTCDMEGQFRLWAIEKAVGSRAVCVGLFDAQTNLSTIKPRAFAVGWGLSIILSSNGLSLLECFRTRRKEAPLHVRFSEARGEFFIMMAKTAVVVDAFTGLVKKQFNFVYDQDITAVALDSSASKVLVGDVQGGVGVHRTLNLNRIADACSHNHENEVIGLIYDDRRNLLITTSADRCIHIYSGALGDSSFDKEGNKLHRLELLRSMKEAHDRDISALAFSHRLSLIATCASDRTIRLWDYQKLDLDTVIVERGEGGGEESACCLEFLGGYPLLLVADAMGRLRGWLTRPMVELTSRPVLSVYNTWVVNDGGEEEEGGDRGSGLGGDAGGRDLGESEKSFVITVIGVHEEGGEVEVFTGDEHGVVKRWAFTKAIKKLGLKQVDLPASLGGAYDPDQEFRRNSCLDGLPMTKQVQFRHLLNGGKVPGAVDMMSHLPPPSLLSATEPHHHLHEEQQRQQQQERQKKQNLSVNKLQQHPNASSSSSSNEEAKTAATTEEAVGGSNLVGDNREGKTGRRTSTTEEGEGKTGRRVSSDEREGKTGRRMSTGEDEGEARKKGERREVLISPAATAAKVLTMKRRLSAAASLKMLEVEATASIQVTAGWKAHNAAVSCLEVLQNPNAIVSGSLDKTVKVWSWAGEPLGIVLADSYWAGNASWLFKFDHRPSKERITSQVNNVFEGLDLTKVASRRRQSALDSTMIIHGINSNENKSADKGGAAPGVGYKTFIAAIEEGNPEDMSRNAVPRTLNDKGRKRDSIDGGVFNNRRESGANSARRPSSASLTSARRRSSDSSAIARLAASNAAALLRFTQKQQQRQQKEAAKDGADDPHYAKEKARQERIRQGDLSPLIGMLLAHQLEHCLAIGTHHTATTRNRGIFASLEAKRRTVMDRYTALAGGKSAQESEAQLTRKHQELLIQEYIAVHRNSITLFTQALEKRTLKNQRKISLLNTATSTAGLPLASSSTMSPLLSSSSAMNLADPPKGLPASIDLLLQSKQETEKQSKEREEEKKYPWGRSPFAPYATSQINAFPSRPQTAPASYTTTSSTSVLVKANSPTKVAYRRPTLAHAKFEERDQMLLCMLTPSRKKSLFTRREKMIGQLNDILEESAHVLSDEQKGSGSLSSATTSTQQQQGHQQQQEEKEETDDSFSFLPSYSPPRRVSFSNVPTAATAAIEEGEEKERLPQREQDRIKEKTEKEEGGDGTSRRRSSISMDKSSKNNVHEEPAQQPVRKQSAKMLRCQMLIQGIEEGFLDERERRESTLQARARGITQKKKRKDSRHEAKILTHSIPKQDRGKTKVMRDLKKDFQKAKLSAQTLDNKNTSRLGPYSIKDVLDFVTFFDFFDKNRSGDLSVGSIFFSPAYAKNQEKFQPLLDALGIDDGSEARHVEEKDEEGGGGGGKGGQEGLSVDDEKARAKLLNSRLLPIDEVLRRVFRFGKYEELQRMRNIMEVVHLTEGVFLEAVRHRRQGLSPDAEHEINNTMALLEKRGCGTITVRELCEVMDYRGLWISSLYTTNELEKDLLIKLDADQYKELDVKDMLLCYRHVFSKGGHQVVHKILSLVPREAKMEIRERQSIVTNRSSSGSSSRSSISSVSFGDTLRDGSGTSRSSVSFGGTVRSDGSGTRGDSGSGIASSLGSSIRSSDSSSVSIGATLRSTICSRSGGEQHRRGNSYLG